MRIQACTVINCTFSEPALLSTAELAPEFVAAPVLTVYSKSMSPVLSLSTVFECKGLRAADNVMEIILNYGLKSSYQAECSLNYVQL